MIRMKIQQLAIKAMLTSKRSVTLLLLLAFLIVFSLNSSGLGIRQTAFIISGKVIGGPPALRARQGGNLVVSLEGNVARRPAPRGAIIDEELKRVSLRAPVASDVAVTFYGKAGIHVLNGHGEALWKSELQTFNRPAVAAGDVRGDGTMQIVTTSEAGHLKLFSRSGTVLGDLGLEFLRALFS